MPKDHHNHYFGSINEMAIQYHINPSTLRYRLREWGKRGIPLACILTMSTDRHTLRNFDTSKDKAISITLDFDDNKRTRCEECKDHLGHTFSSIREMCEYWNISYQVYNSRIHREHWSVEKALTTPVAKNANQPVVDPNGVWWESISKMCKAWKVNEKTYKARMATGKYEMLEALTMLPKNKGRSKT